MADFERLMDMVTGQAEDALEKCSKKADLTDARDAEHIKNLMKIMHYADCMMEDDAEYSQDGGWRADGTYSGTDGTMYDRGSSYARGGRHWVRGHYSRASMGGVYSGRRGYSRGSLSDHIEEMMAEAKTDQERQAIERLKRELMR